MRKPAPQEVTVLRATSPDPGVTPVRLYQLFTGLGSGGVLTQPVAAQILKERGWTVTEVELAPDESVFLSRLPGAPGKPLSGKVTFVRCEGVAEERATGQILCSMPGKLDRAVIRLEDAQADLSAPALVFLPRASVSGVAALTVPVGRIAVTNAAKEGAQKAMDAYAELMKFYAAYLEYRFEFPGQGEPTLRERNGVLRLRNLLAKLAQPFSILGGELVKDIPPVGGEGWQDSIGLIFATNSPKAAQILLAQTKGQLLRSRAIVREISKDCCKRLLAVMERRSPLSPDPTSALVVRQREAGARLLVAFGCRPMQPLVVEGPPAKELAILGGFLASAGLAMSGVRRWQSSKAG